MSDTGTVISPLPSSVDAYIRRGWRLVPIAPASKGPTAPGWNRAENTLHSATLLPANHGIGLAHAYSGTMALDVDDWHTAADWLKDRGVDLSALVRAPDAVGIESGRPGHAKLLYAMPGITLPSKKVSVGGRIALEFRCATSNGLTVQDVLPPTIHPDTGRPYQWACSGTWENMPLIPEPLLRVWTSLLDLDGQRSIATGDPLATSWDEVRSALWTISPDCDRATWIAVGMALHWAGAQTDQQAGALALWDEWSATSQQDKYPGPRELDTQWRAMRTDKMTHVTLGTLFHHARDAGWTRPAPDVAELFAAVGEAPTAPTVLMREGLVPTPPEMPLELWPESLRAVSEELSRTIGCDPMVPLISGLSAACACADGRTRLELMPGYEVPPVLWLCTIGRPSDKKSPASRPMMKILREFEEADRARYQQALLAWEGEEAAYNVAKKHYLEVASSPEALLGVPLPTVPVLPPQPVPLRMTVSDITSQKLVRYAAERPRGFLCYLDEMASWARKVCDPRSGEDRSAWVQAYEAAPYSMDRVGAGSIYAPNYAMSIYGNIQPAVLQQHIHAMTADGLLQRFIPFPLRQDWTRRGEPIPECLSLMPQWESALRVIYAIGPQRYRLSAGAFHAFRAFQSWYEQRKRDEVLLGSVDQYLTALGKIEGTAGRLILMFHMIEAPFSAEVSAELAERVIEIVRSYVIPALSYTLNEISGLAVDHLNTWVREYVIQYASETPTLTLHQIRRSARRQVESVPIWQAEMRICDAMVPLEAARWVMRIEDAPQRHQVVWAIHPALATLFADHREQVVRAKQRINDSFARTAIARGHQNVTRRIAPGYDPATMDP